MLTKVNNLSITGYEEEHLKFGTYSSYSYEYYADGNIKTVTDNKGEVTNYIYDGAGRLIAERYDNESGENSYANMYRYDERGNRISKQHNAGSKEEIDNFLASINPYAVMLTSLEDELLDTWQDQTENARYIDTYYIYDNNNRLTSQKSNYDDEYLNDKREYTYDNNGNLIHKYVEVYYDDSAPEDPTVISCSKDDISYEYNDLYQLIGVEKTNIDDNEIITEYAYDAAGQRISKTVDGYTTYHIWDNQSNIIGEYGASTATYYRGLGGEIISDGVSHYAYNGHGDTTSLTQQVDNSIVFAETYQYDAFGNTTTEGLIENENPFRYNGQYTDDETGLIYLRNRYYDPEIGRFISEDPIKDGLNWYVYCEGNPVMFVDPLGLDSYVFYDPTMEAGQEGYMTKDEALYYKKMSEEIFGTTTHLVPVKNAGELKEYWNSNMGKDEDGNDIKIDAVYILLHGSATGKKDDGVGFMYFQDGSRIAAKNSGVRNWEQDTTVACLEEKNFDTLYLSVCNSANPDIYNLTYSFMQQMNIQYTIVAWDGGTIFDYNDYTLKGGGPRSNQHTFNKYNTSGRERYGKRVFDFKNGKWVEKESARTFPGRWW